MNSKMLRLAVAALACWHTHNPLFAFAAELTNAGEPSIGGEEYKPDEVEGTHLSIVRRAAQQVQVQGNNIGTPQDATAGSLAIWQYPNRFLQSANTPSGPGLPSRIGKAEKAADSGRIDLRRRDQQDDSLEVLKPRQSSTGGKPIYISANTCRQPNWVGSQPQTEPPPQLVLYVSTTTGNQQLGPDGDDNAQVVYPFVNGFVNATVPNTSGDWYMAVYAPNYSSNFTGAWNYMLAVSLDVYFFNAVQTEEQFLHLVDTDNDAALLISAELGTQNATDSDLFRKWMDLTPPFVMFAMNQNVTSYMGVESSFCGLQNAVSSGRQIQAATSDLQGNTTHVQMHMISRGIGNYPRQQFYVTGLNSSSSYFAYMAMAGNSTAAGDGIVGGGGTVWPQMQFRTKTDGNCQLMFDLPFCDEVAYAVPANPKGQNASLVTLDGLRQFYDNYTSFWYSNFADSLQLLPCNITSNAQYSLAKNCNDCSAAYKEWLCAVSIPRCEDFSNPAEYLQVRNVGQPFYNNGSMLDDSFLQANYIPMPGAPTIEGSIAFQQTYISSFATNQSRNPVIDASIAPGPYKEVKPCEDLCYSLMQSCPAALQFVCPYPGRGLEASYGKRGAPGTVECSFLGAYYYQSDASKGATQLLRNLVLTGLVIAILL